MRSWLGWISGIAATIGFIVAACLFVAAIFTPSLGALIAGVICLLIAGALSALSDWALTP